MRIMNALRCDDKEGGDTQVVVRGEVEDDDEEVIAAEEQEPPKKEVLRITRKENCYVCLDDVVHFWECPVCIGCICLPCQDMQRKTTRLHKCGLCKHRDAHFVAYTSVCKPKQPKALLLKSKLPPKPLLASQSIRKSLLASPPIRRSIRKPLLALCYSK